MPVLAGFNNFGDLADRLGVLFCHAQKYTDSLSILEAIPYGAGRAYRF